MVNKVLHLPTTGQYLLRIKHQTEHFSCKDIVWWIADWGWTNGQRMNMDTRVAGMPQSEEGFFLFLWAGRSVRLLDSTSFCTKLLWHNKTRYQRMTQNTSLPGILLLLFLPPRLLWSKRITESQRSLFAAMLEGRWQEQYTRNIPVISKEELKVKLFSKGEGCAATSPPSSPQFT